MRRTSWRRWRLSIGRHCGDLWRRCSIVERVILIILRSIFQWGRRRWRRSRPGCVNRSPTVWLWGWLTGQRGRSPGGSSRRYRRRHGRRSHSRRRNRKCVLDAGLSPMLQSILVGNGRANISVIVTFVICAFLVPCHVIACRSTRQAAGWRRRRGTGLRRWCGSSPWDRWWKSASPLI